MRLTISLFGREVVALVFDRDEPPAEGGLGEHDHLGAQVEMSYDHRLGSQCPPIPSLEGM